MPQWLTVDNLIMSVGVAGDAGNERLVGLRFSVSVSMNDTAGIRFFVFFGLPFGVSTFLTLDPDCQKEPLFTGTFWGSREGIV